MSFQEEDTVLQQEDIVFDDIPNTPSTDNDATANDDFDMESDSEMDDDLNMDDGFDMDDDLEGHDGHKVDSVSDTWEFDAEHAGFKMYYDGFKGYICSKCLETKAVNIF